MKHEHSVILDACVLANFAVCDLLLRLAEHPRLYLPKWSNIILDEVHRTQTNILGWDYKLADSFRAAVLDAFPEAMVSGFEVLIPQMTNQLKDRHVLAASVYAKAETIVTFNLKDFKSTDLQKWHIAAIHPQDFLLKLYECDPDLVSMRIQEIAKKKGVSFNEILKILSKSLPSFSNAIISDKQQ